MVALAHRTSGANNSPYCEATAEGHEGFFAKTAPYLVNGIFVVKVAGACVSKGKSPNCTVPNEKGNDNTHAFSSKEEGRGALFGGPKDMVGAMCECGGGGEVACVDKSKWIVFTQTEILF